MSNTWMVLNIIVLLGLIIYIIRCKRTPKKHYNQKKGGAVSHLRG